MAVATRIVAIGNSRGVRLPKGLLEQAELPEHVELHAVPGALVIYDPARRGRRREPALTQVREALTAADAYTSTPKDRRQQAARREAAAPRPTFVPATAVLAAFAGAPRIAAARFRADVDAVIDQDPTPRR